MNILLSFRTLEPLHVGSGQGAGHIDLPIMREAATSWPVVPGSSLKGALRESFEQSGADSCRIHGVFGKEGEADKGVAGSLCPPDCFPVLLPVPSLFGGFAWVTCPLALRRLKELGALAGVAIPSLQKALEPGQVLVSQGSQLVRRGSDQVQLNDIKSPRTESALTELSVAFAPLAGVDSAEILPQLAVVDNSFFRHFSRTCMQVATKVTLEKGRRVAKKGGLRTEESVPVDAVFVGLARFQKIGPVDPAVEGAWFQETLPKVMQFGGKASTGHGLCRLLSHRKEEKA